MPNQRAATDLRDYARPTLVGRIRAAARRGIVRAGAMGARIDEQREWLFFPYYHHVFDDERHGLEGQIAFMKGHGDIIGIEDALDALSRPGAIGGRYFCITFDDGFRNCLTNAVPILVEQGCRAAFFLPTAYVGRQPGEAPPAGRPDFRSSPVEMLTWDDCRRMREAGMTIGSHTCTHPRILPLDVEEFGREVRDSKIAIEAELGAPCLHFAATWGRPVLDFDPDVHPAVVRAAGYRCFLTTLRGKSYAGDDPFLIRRDHTVARDGPLALRFFLAAWPRPPLLHVSRS